MDRLQAGLAPTALLAPEEAVARLRDLPAGTPVLVDLDETLLLRSSTELYLAALRPRWLASLVLGLLELVRPWALSRSPRRVLVHRDRVRVLVTTLLLPWSLPRWRRVAPALGAAHVNPVLAQELAPGPVQVVTFGFRRVVEPLLAGMPLEVRLVLSGRLRADGGLRRDGKAAALERLLGADVLHRAAVVTDSEDDRDLLERCAVPLRVLWPGARHDVAFDGGYQPFLYTRRGKRPDQRYLLQHVVLEDGLLLWLAAVAQSPSPLALAVAVASLHSAFWLVYEIGYHENDVLAARREARPQLSSGVAAYAGRMQRGSAWACAALLSVPGLLALAASGAVPAWLPGPQEGAAGLLALTGLWAGYLVASRGLYWTYNRLPEAARGMPYALLQLARTLGYALLLPIGTAGALVLLAVVLTRWLAYASYRDSGVPWRGSHRMTLVWALLVVLPVGLVVDPAGTLRWETALAAAWFVARAHRPLRQLVATVAEGRRAARDEHGPGAGATDGPAPVAAGTRSG